MKYDARACHFNMDTGCVELLLRDGRNRDKGVIFRQTAVINLFQYRSSFNVALFPLGFFRENLLNFLDRLFWRLRLRLRFFNRR